MPLLWLMGAGVLTAYVVWLVGPPAKPSVLTQAQLDQLAASNAATASEAAHQALAQQPVAGVPQLFEPGFQGQPGASVAGLQGASVAGALFWRGEFAPDGARIVYDVRGQPHHVYGA